MCQDGHSRSVSTAVFVPEVVQVGDLLHAEPAELTAADGAGHVIAASIVHLNDVGTTARAWLDVVSWRRKNRHLAARRHRLWRFLLWVWLTS